MLTISTFSPLRNRAASAATFGAAFVRALWMALAACDIWMDRARQRRALRALDDRLLRDVGLSRSDVEWETSKPFWKP